ncbi:MAG: hypothetical protein LBG80_00820 [Bacteroidales bacterium]|jgi:hypothetical protein|nr:hypothetical protein [Bacteroidales bacterium]
MKKVTFILYVVFFTIGFLSCKQAKPEFVVERYYIHFYRNEYEEIQRYVMPEHRAYYEILSKYISNQNEINRKHQIKVKEIKCTITGDTVAMCSCLVEENNQDRREQIVQLKKINNKWFVNQGKENGVYETFMNDINDENEENVQRGEPPLNEND